MQKPKTKALGKDEIKLPYMGKDKFRQLMRMGLGYENGTFYIRNLNRAEEIKDTLSEILNEKITFYQICLICGKKFLCLDCEFYQTCSSRDLPFHCICKDCTAIGDLYNRYVDKNKTVT